MLQCKRYISCAVRVPRLTFMIYVHTLCVSLIIVYFLCSVQTFSHSFPFCLSVYSCVTKTTNNTNIFVILCFLLFLSLFRPFPPSLLYLAKRNSLGCDRLYVHRQNRFYPFLKTLYESSSDSTGNQVWE